MASRPGAASFRASAKLYLKEAFAREHSAAPDQKISTWARFRLDVARNRFRILRTPNGGGPFVLKENAIFTRPDVLERQTAWYEDFSNWQEEHFQDDLKAAATLLADARNEEARRLSRELAAIVADAGGPRVGVSHDLANTESRTDACEWPRYRRRHAASNAIQLAICSADSVLDGAHLPVSDAGGAGHLLVKLIQLRG